MNLIQRVTDILIKPDETWPRLEKEVSTTASSKNYLLALALIPALAMLMDHPVSRNCVLGINFRFALIAVIFKAVGVYALGVAIVLTVSHVVCSLATAFGARASKAHALNLITHAATAGFVGSFFFIDALWSLPGLVAISYSIYLIYTGLPAMMKCPPDKAGAYVAAALAWTLFAGVLVSAVLTTLLSGMPDVLKCSIKKNVDVLPMSLVWSVTIILIFVPLFAALRHQVWPNLDKRGQTPFVERRKHPRGPNIDLARLSEMAHAVIVASEKIDDVHSSGNHAAHERAREELESAIDAMASLVNYGGVRTPLSSKEFKSIIPDALGTLRREPTKADNAQTTGRPSSSYKASYSAGVERVDLYIRDFVGGVGGFVAFANWAKEVLDQGNAKGVSRYFNVGVRLIREEVGPDSVGGRINVLLGNGVMLEIHGQGMNFLALKQLVGAIKLGAIETLKRP